MIWSREVFRCHRTYFMAPRCLQFASSEVRRKSTLTGSKIDYLGVEQRWQAKWDSRGTKIQEERDMGFRADPIVPFYVDHIRRHTLMGTLQSILCSIKRNVGSRKGKTNMVEQILASYDNLPLGSQMESLRTHSSQYGADIVRCCTVFSQEADTENRLCEQSLLETQRWFECTWEAVRVAHQLYEDTQAYPSLEAPDIESRNDPDFIDDFVDHNLELVASEVHVPPPSPVISDNADEDTCALWLASQEAILSMTGRSKSVDHYRVRSQLTCLMVSIASYEGEHCPPIIDCGVHYHSTRILLSLLATIAPSFVEECWLALHYGHDQWREDESHEDEATDAKSSFSYCEELIHEDLREYGLQDLPRRSNACTLSSIFAQPFPVSDSLVVIKSLKRRSADSDLRRIAQKEAQNHMDRWKEAVVPLDSNGIGSS
ncbi:hypothetical protein PSPO01_16268 [Paraphaeosphaeria sporulosa]